MRSEPRRIARLIALAGAALLAAGCDNELCIRHSDCDPGLVCSSQGACLVPVDPDGGGSADASPDAGLDAADAAPDAAPDAAVDAGIDADPATLESPYAAPISPELGLPHNLTPFRGARR